MDRASNNPTPLISQKLALSDIIFLVLDDELDTEELLTGLLLLRHMKMDTRTLLDLSRSLLDGMDFQCVLKKTKYGGAISRMTVARMNNLHSENRLETDLG